MKTDTPQRTVTNPAYSYTNLSTPILNKNAKNFREGVLLASRHGVATPGAIASLNASKIEGDADIQAAEAARKQQSIDTYQNRKLAVDQFNAGQLSRNDMYNNMRYNEKLGLTQANTNNFATSLLGNKARQDANALDKDKAIIMSRMEGTRGINKRLLLSDNTYQEAMRRRYGNEFVDNYIKNGE